MSFPGSPRRASEGDVVGVADVAEPGEGEGVLGGDAELGVVFEEVPEEVGDVLGVAAGEAEVLLEDARDRVDAVGRGRDGNVLEGRLVVEEPLLGAVAGLGEEGGHGAEELDGLREVALVFREELAVSGRLGVEERLAREELEDEAPDAPDVGGGAEGPDAEDALGAAVLARLDVARVLAWGEKKA